MPAAVTGGTGSLAAATLRAVVDRLVERDVGALADDNLGAELVEVDRQCRRLQARAAALIAERTRRAARAARRDRPDDPRAADRARRDVAQELRGALRWSPSQLKQAQRTADRLATAPAARAAFSAGDLGVDHARVLTATLDRIGDRDVRDRVERELVGAALVEDPVQFGRTARGLLLREAPAAARRDEVVRHGRRAGRLAQTPDGMLHLGLDVAGLDAEVVATAVDVFRTPDAPGAPKRSAEQRTADAVVAALRAALDHGVDTTAHGNRPHVQVVITWEELCNSAGDYGRAMLGHTGPVSAQQVRRLLDDSTITRLLTGPDSLPLDTGRATRRVGPGIWRALVARDRHCTYPGCDAPPGWCDAAHVDDRRWAGGAGVSVGELALACRNHHRIIDQRGLIGTLHDGRVVWRPPDP